MSELATTKLSSKGQIVIPEIIRHRMDLHTGDQFVVLADKDVVILKIIPKPTMSEFNKLITKARKQAKDANLTKQDIEKAIKKSRKK